MALAVQHSDQLENEVAEVAPTVEKDGFAPQDHTTFRVDTPVGLWVLEVVLVGPQSEAIKVNLEGCRTALVDRTTTPAGPKVGLVRAVLTGHKDNQVGLKVGPRRVSLAGCKVA